MFLNR